MDTDLQCTVNKSLKYTSGAPTVQNLIPKFPINLHAELIIHKLSIPH